MRRNGFLVPARPLKTNLCLRPWPARRWCSYFLRQHNTLLAIPWECGHQLTPEERATVAPSLGEFQQGEGLEGGHFFACVSRYGQETGDWDYVRAHRLFMAEEKRHARDLARYLGLAGIPLLARRSRWNEAFCWLGSRGGLETTLAIILMVEVIAQTYYTALRGTTRCLVLRRLCDQILRDEKSHVRFQAERLAILRRQRSSLALFVTHCLEVLLFFGAGMACGLGHHRLLWASGFGFFRFWAEAWTKQRSARRQKDPRNYAWKSSSTNGLHLTASSVIAHTGKGVQQCIFNQRQRHDASHLQIRIAPVGDEHVSRFVSDEQGRTDFHGDGLGSGATCPEDGDFTGANLDRITEVRFG